jgi:hypothetical protein
MAHGRPRQPNDPSVMSSVEAALTAAARPALLARTWHWRYELALLGGVLSGTTSIGVVLGPGWLAVTAAAGLAAIAAALAWPPSRQRLIARAWCIITPHRVRTGCNHAWVQTRDGRLPVVLYTVPARRPGLALPEPGRRRRPHQATGAAFALRVGVRLTDL